MTDISDLSEFGTNPAERVHAILHEAKNLMQLGTTARGSILWSRVFGLSDDNNDRNDIASLITVAQRLVQFDKLIDEAEAALRGIEGLSDKYFRPFPRIREIPRQSLAMITQDVGAVINSITEGDMTVLEFCAERLKGVVNEPVIDEEELTDILDAIELLSKDVATLGDQQLKTFILDQLESMRRAIFEYRIRGPERLKEGLAVIVGNLVVERYAGSDVIGRNASQEQVSGFEKLFNRFASVVSFAEDSTALLGAVKVALLPGGELCFRTSYLSYRELERRRCGPVATAPRF